VKELAEVQIPNVEERVRGASSSSSSWNTPCDLRAFWYKNNVWEIFGHNLIGEAPSASKSNQVTCCDDLSGFLY
jgi:hypothetical protein